MHYSSIYWCKVVSTGVLQYCLLVYYSNVYWYYSSIYWCTAAVSTGVLQQQYLLGYYSSSIYWCTAVVYTGVLQQQCLLVYYSSIYSPKTITVLTC